MCISKTDYSETDDTDVTADDDSSQTRRVRSKVGLLTKFLFVSVVVGFLTLAGTSDDVKKFITPEAFKVGIVRKSVFTKMLKISFAWLGIAATVLETSNFATYKMRSLI